MILSIIYEVTNYKIIWLKQLEIKTIFWGPLIVSEAHGPKLRISVSSN